MCMYVIRSHEVRIQVIYGDGQTQSCVGLEVVPPLNDSERTLSKDWMERHNMGEYALLVVQLSHGDDASRYGEQMHHSRSSELYRKIFTFATGIRRAIESQGQEVTIEEDVRKPKNDDILGS